MDKQATQAGFSFVEVIMTLLLLVVLTGLAAMSTALTFNRVKIASELTTLLADLRQMQIKAMSGEIESGATNKAYGLWIGESEYQVFQGETRSGSVDLGTFEIEGATFSSTFSNDEVVFASGSGQILNFTPGQNTITIYKTGSLQQQTVTLNSYGVVTARE